MFSKFVRNAGWVLAACLVLAGVQARAATISVTKIVPQDYTDISGSVELPLFDSALGTLTTARIKTRLTVDGSIGVRLSPNAPVAKVIGISGSTTSSYTSLLPVIDSMLNGQSATVSYTTGSALKNPGESMSASGPWLQPAYAESAVSTPTELAAFAGPGSFSLSYSTTTPGLTNIGTGGNLSYDQATTAGVEIVLEYDYAPPIDLTLSKSVASTGPYAAGSTVTFDLAARNLGPGTAQPAIVVSDTLPAGLTFVSASGTDWACTHAGQVLTCTRIDTAAALGAGESTSPITVTAMLASGASGALTNTAFVAPAADEPAVETNVSNGYDDGSPATGSNNDASAGVTMANTTQPPTPVPTLSEWSLMLLGLLAMGMAVFRLRRGI